eukprot:TRINITY_DN3724_c0_g1_i5.p4 TRINITY_DN3724_c0_g1~~TRINITY_DN3724_c0_g1_i5.p4  ORF type:complete len:132 (+),score=62.21 TRINITY_DN3724_c0_g1_i5:145-540(+)
MIRRPPRSTHCISSAASDVYKRQYQRRVHGGFEVAEFARQYFTKELLAHPKFKQNTYKDAIKETFFQMDKLLVGEEGKQKIIKIKEAEAERLAIEKAKQEEEKKKKKKKNKKKKKKKKKARRRWRQNSSGG